MLFRTLPPGEARRSSGPTARSADHPQHSPAAAITATTYSATVLDEYIGCDPTSNAINVTLCQTGGGGWPQKPGRLGGFITVKDETGNAATHSIALTAASGETIDRSSTLVMLTNYQAVRLKPNGTGDSVV